MNLFTSYSAIFADNNHKLNKSSHSIFALSNNLILAQLKGVTKITFYVIFVTP